MERKPLENKVAKKAIIQIDLESFISKATDIVAFDIKSFLFKELLLKEKDYREQLAQHNFSSLKDKYVYIYCSSKAIVPLWAYMLIATYLNPIVKEVCIAENDKIAKEIFLVKHIEKLDLSVYTNKRVIIKGCSNNKISTNIYISLVNKLQAEVKSIMFGEACSMLPIYKKQ